MFAVLGVFAAAGAEEANAQVANAAVGQVYSPVGMVSIRVISGMGPTVDGNDSLAAIVLAISTFRVDNSYGTNPTELARQFQDFNQIVDGVPASGGRAVEAGRVTRFYDEAIADNGGTIIRNFDYTVRIFTDGTDLFMARGEGQTREPIRMVSVIAPRTAATLAANEFYIRESDWTTVTVLESGVVGFRAVQCAETHLAAADEIMCDFRTAENTECTGGQVFTLADETDETQGGTCQDPPEDMTTPPGMTVSVTPPANTATVTPPENGDDDISDSGDGRNHAPVFVFGGLMLMGAVGYIMSGGDLDAFAFSPSFGYSATESGYSANVGGRMNFQKDEWRLFWTAGQANANGKFGDFRYASGGEYKTDFWQASFSESVQGEIADYDFSLSADLQGGIWSLSPVYRMHSRLEEGESATRNSLNLEGILRYDGWKITPSAGFQWRRAEEFADGGKFRLEAVRKF